MRLQSIPRLNPRRLPLVLLREFLRLLHHGIHFLLGQPTILGGDRDALGTLRRHVLRRHLQQPIGIDLERDAHLRLPPRRRGQVRHLEQTQKVIVLSPRSFALEHVDGHELLIVLDRAKFHRRFRGYRRAALDQHGHQPPIGIRAQTQRRDVQQHEIPHGLPALSAQYAPLYRRAHRHALVGVDSRAGLLSPEEFPHEFPHPRYARRSSHEYDFVDLVRPEHGVLHHLPHRTERLLEERVVELLEFRATERVREVVPGQQVLDVETRRELRRESAFDAFHLPPKLLQCALVLPDVLPVFSLYGLHEVIHDGLVDVAPA
mmetsp:Transcript_458/g.781  ORF Transcript_458/g.781 Transcript_458/m.781 type:complete len:318 (+) Transcript_458:270-1223(+)